MIKLRKKYAVIKIAEMNPYYFLYYSAFAMARKLASKNLMDRVPSSAAYFVNGIVIMVVILTFYYFSGPPQHELPAKVGAIIVVIIILTVNDFIFLKKDKYKAIIEYYDTRYMNQPPWILFLVVPLCYILLCYIMALIHGHYSEYYRIHGLK